MKQQTPSTAAGGLQAVQDQFDCLVRSLVMSTFALDLKGSTDAQPIDGNVRGGGGGEGGYQGKGRGMMGEGRWRSEIGTRDASGARARNGLCNTDEQLLRRVSLSWSWCRASICRPLEDFPCWSAACACKERGFDKPGALQILAGHTRRTTVCEMHCQAVFPLSHICSS